MNSPEEIDALARMRFDEAKILFQHNKFDGAYYLSGYSIELLLKSKICRRLGIPNLFSDDETTFKELEGISEVRKALKTHNLFTLLIFSGLKVPFDQAKATNKNLSLANSLLFQKWSESLRYKPCGHIAESECKNLINLLERDNGIMQWITRN
ncbi:MAG: hypothetical protein M3Q95_02645 [Bacteroidota bacterium]|nr:hypothetical protein [Bacteroidota bacterium]